VVPEAPAERPDLLCDGTALGPAVQAERTRLREEALQQLRALGYLDEPQRGTQT
jgi:hypothetical protein